MSIPTDPQKAQPASTLQQKRRLDGQASSIQNVSPPTGLAANGYNDAARSFMSPGGAASPLGADNVQAPPQSLPSPSIQQPQQPQQPGTPDTTSSIDQTLGAQGGTVLSGFDNKAGAVFKDGDYRGQTPGQAAVQIAQQQANQQQRDAGRFMGGTMRNADNSPFTLRTEAERQARIASSPLHTQASKPVFSTRGRDQGDQGANFGTAQSQAYAEKARQMGFSARRPGDPFDRSGAGARIAAAHGAPKPFQPRPDAVITPTIGGPSPVSSPAPTPTAASAPASPPKPAASPVLRTPPGYVRPFSREHAAQRMAQRYPALSKASPMAASFLSTGEDIAHAGVDFAKGVASAPARAASAVGNVFSAAYRDTLARRQPLSPGAAAFAARLTKAR